MQDTPAIPDCLDEDLKRLARARDTDNYKSVAERCDIGPHEMMFSTLVRLLTAVNERERARNAPLLAAVVVNKKSRMPGPGFFKWAREHNLLQGTERQFWKSELERFRAYWADNDPPPNLDLDGLSIQQTAKPSLRRSRSPMGLIRILFARL